MIKICAAGCLVEVIVLSKKKIKLRIHEFYPHFYVANLYLIFIKPIKDYNLMPLIIKGRKKKSRFFNAVADWRQ